MSILTSGDQHRPGDRRCARLALDKTHGGYLEVVTVATYPLSYEDRVVTRKVCGGNRTARGADTHSVLASVLRTIQQRQLQLDAAEVLSKLLRSPESIHRARAADDLISTTR